VPAWAGLLADPNGPEVPERPMGWAGVGQQAVAEGPKKISCTNCVHIHQRSAKSKSVRNGTARACKIKATQTRAHFALPSDANSRPLRPQASGWAQLAFSWPSTNHLLEAVLRYLTDMCMCPRPARSARGQLAKLAAIIHIKPGQPEDHRPAK
jgi:hypothetical protein